MGRYVVQLVGEVAGCMNVLLCFVCVLLCLGESVVLFKCVIMLSRGRERTKKMDLY